eukprot:UN02207
MIDPIHPEKIKEGTQPLYIKFRVQMFFVRLENKFFVKKYVTSGNWKHTRNSDVLRRQTAPFFVFGGRNTPLKFSVFEILK